MYPFDENNPFRKLSVKLLFNPLYRTKLSANKITGLNFLTLGLGSVILFVKGWDVLGLLTAGLMAMVDYVDGTIARERNQVSKLGKYLDTSLDWLYLMLLIGAISYHHNILPIGYITLVALVFGNWVEYNGNSDVVMPMWLGKIPILTISILLGKAEYGIILIMFVQVIKTTLQYWRSLWKLSKD